MSDAINLGPYKRSMDDDSVVYIEHHEGSAMELGYLCMGLAGETGELVDVFKKAVRNGHDDFPRDLRNLTPEILNEMGDVMWYFFQLLRFMDVELEDILDMNMAKLQRRHKAGTIADLRRK